MTTISNVAQRILDENNYVAADISATAALTKVEYLIDNAIDYINLQADTCISHLSGTAESKSLTGSDSEVYTVKILSALLLRAYKDRGPQATISPVSVSQSVNDPQYQLFSDLLTKALDKLKSATNELEVSYG